MARKRSKRGVTLESLAAMVKRGFDDVSSKMAKKAEMDRQFYEVNTRLEKMDGRLDRIEKMMLLDHKRRIEHLEEEMKELKELLRIP